MNLEEIKTAVREGKTVHWSSDNYTVIEDKIGRFFIHSQWGNSYQLLSRDDVKTTESPEGFYIEKPVTK